MSAGHLGDEAETQKVMSQKCIESMYFRTIFCDIKNVDFTGVALLQDAVVRTAQAGGILGIRGLLVHALSIEAKAFYEHHGFVASPTQPMILILSLKGHRDG